MPDIKPRIDESGVPRCGINVPCGSKQFADVMVDCDVDGRTMACGEICPHATARFAAENAEMRELLVKMLEHTDRSWSQEMRALLERNEQTGTWTDGGKVWESEPEGGE